MMQPMHGQMPPMMGNMGMSDEDNPANWSGQESYMDQDANESEIRTKALQVLTPQEIMLVGQAVTPTIIQVMAKLFGDRVVELLEPLVGLDQAQAAPAQQEQMQPSNALAKFNAMGGSEGYQPPTPVRGKSF